MIIHPRCPAAIVATLALCFARLANAGPYSAAVLADNPVAYWQFEDGSLGEILLGATAKDSVGLGPNGDHPGTYTRRGTTDGPQLVGGVPGIGGLAAQFVAGTTPATNGDYILTDTLANVGANIDDVGVTFEFWFKNQQASVALSRLFGISHERPTSTPTQTFSFGVFESAAANGTQMFVRDNSNITQQLSFNTALANVNDGDWHHIAWVISPGVAAGGMTVYVDGEAMMLTNTDTRFPPAAQSNFVNFDKPFTIGAENVFGANGVRNFVRDGMIDEFAVYSTALSQAQIHAHLAAVPEPASCGLAVLAFAGIAARFRKRL